MIKVEQKYKKKGRASMNFCIPANIFTRTHDFPISPTYVSFSSSYFCFCALHSCDFNFGAWREYPAVSSVTSSSFPSTYSPFDASLLCSLSHVFASRHVLQTVMVLKIYRWLCLTLPDWKNLILQHYYPRNFPAM